MVDVRGELMSLRCGSYDPMIMFTAIYTEVEEKKKVGGKGASHRPQCGTERASIILGFH